MSKKFSTILIAAALILVAALLLLPGSATASQLLGITITPTFTPETPIPTTPETEEPATDTPTPTATEVPPDTPTPTSEVKKPPTATAKPKATQELVLLPETGEYPIDPQQGMQWIFATSLLLLIGGIFLRAAAGSQRHD